MQLRFTSLTVTSLREDLHLQECAHAGRTKLEPRRARLFLGELVGAVAGQPVFRLDLTQTADGIGFQLRCTLCDIELMPGRGWGLGFVRLRQGCALHARIIDYFLESDCRLVQFASARPARAHRPSGQASQKSAIQLSGLALTGNLALLCWI